jgi:hypothetical protein
MRSFLFLIEWSPDQLLGDVHWRQTHIYFGIIELSRRILPWMHLSEGLLVLLLLHEALEIFISLPHELDVIFGNIECVDLYHLLHLSLLFKVYWLG